MALVSQTGGFVDESVSNALAIKHESSA